MGAEVRGRADAAVPLDGSPQMDELARLIRALYFGHYRNERLRRDGVRSNFGDEHVVRYDGGADDSGTFRPIWPKIAAFCVAHELEPELHVKAQFAADPRRLPRPNMLLGERALKNYERASRVQAREIAQALEIQQRDLLYDAKWKVIQSRDEIGLDRAVQLVLRDRTTGYSGLFRYCFALRAGDVETAAMFRDAALRQYIFLRSLYDRHWAEWIPVSLRDEAAAYYSDRVATGA